MRRRRGGENIGSDKLTFVSPYVSVPFVGGLSINMWRRSPRKNLSVPPAEKIYEKFYKPFNICNRLDKPDVYPDAGCWCDICPAAWYSVSADSADCSRILICQTSILPMRQDLMYTHPDNFDQALIFFRHCFEIWIKGYEKWGDEDFQATFVKDPTVPSGVIYYCPRGNRDRVQVISIPTSF